MPPTDPALARAIEELGKACAAELQRIEAAFQQFAADVDGCSGDIRHWFAEMKRYTTRSNGGTTDEP